MMEEKEIYIDARAIRRDYEGPRLLEEEAGDDPFLLFRSWFEEALQKEKEPNAMVLVTVDSNGLPDGRVMLLKEVRQEGFVFFTNYQSKKGMDLLYRPVATLVFFWVELMKQVRVYGNVEKVSEEESEEYFHSRPFESRVSAYVSRQSQIIHDRNSVEEEFQNALRFFHEKSVPRPAEWGGYILKPVKFEFWQGRPARFHDRLVYEATPERKWKIYRLYP